MTSAWGDAWIGAELIVGALSLLSVIGALFWMTRNLGEAEPNKMVDVGTWAIRELVEPAIGLTVMIALALFVYFSYQDNSR